MGIVFWNSSVRSMKAVLLHIGNKAALVPIAHSIAFKEFYLDLKYLPYFPVYKRPLQFLGKNSGKKFFSNE